MPQFLAAADTAVLMKTQSYGFENWVSSQHKPDATLNIGDIDVVLFRLWDTNSHQLLAKAEAEMKSHKVWQGGRF